MARKKKDEKIQEAEIVEVEETESTNKNEEKKTKGKVELNKVFNGSWVTTVLFLLLGLFLLIKPALANSIIGYSIGAIVTISGIISLVKYFKAKEEVRYVNFQLVYGILTVIAGLAIFLNPLAISKLIIICLGIWIVINGAMKLSTAVVLKKCDEDIWTFSLVIAILTILCGTFLIFNPFSGTKIVTQVIGVFIIVYSILDIIESIIIRNK